MEQWGEHLTTAKPLRLKVFLKNVTDPTYSPLRFSFRNWTKDLGMARDHPHTMETSQSGMDNPTPRAIKPIRVESEKEQEGRDGRGLTRIL